MRNTIIAKLKQYDACKEAVAWVRAQPNKQAAWDSCERGDWMLWYCARVSGGPASHSRKRVILAACDCASLSLKFAGKHRKVVMKCIRTARAWAHGQASMDQVRSAANAANAAYTAYAARAAAYTAYAAYTANAVYAANVAASAAYTAAVSSKKCAQIVREHYPKPPILRGKK